MGDKREILLILSMIKYQSEVSILGPVGYGPTTLPLRYSDFYFNEVENNIYIHYNIHTFLAFLIYWQDLGVRGELRLSPTYYRYTTMCDMYWKAWIINYPREHIVSIQNVESITKAYHMLKDVAM